jgi:hypothetical protein
MKKLPLFPCTLLMLVLTCRAEDIAAVTADHHLFFFDHTALGTINGGQPILGVPAGETFLGIDYRPAIGGLYALGSSGHLYSIGFSRTIGAFQFGPTLPLSGTSFGFDFNPTTDRIRLTSDADQNLQVNPADGTLSATDPPLAFAAGDPNFGVNPNVVASAYTNNFVGAAATVLYDIDSNLDALLIQNPNDGTLRTIGPLGVDTSANVGFDISSVTGRAFALLTVGGSTGIYTIDLGSGAATLLGPIANLGAGQVTDIAVLPHSRLQNLSTRGNVGTGDDVLIGGLIIGGAGTTKVLVRAIGPSLAANGVPHPLSDPILTIYDSGGRAIASNDDWRTSEDAAQIMNSGLTPTDDRESAILLTAGPGAYTAIITGKNGETGIAVVETYQQ